MLDLVIYSRNDCPNCECLIEELDKINVGYNKIVIDNDYKAKAKLTASGFDSLPVLQFNDGSMFSGSTETMIQTIKDYDIGSPV